MLAFLGIIFLILVIIGLIRFLWELLFDSIALFIGAILVVCTIIGIIVLVCCFV